MEIGQVVRDLSQFGFSLIFWDFSVILVWYSKAGKKGNKCDWVHLAGCCGQAQFRHLNKDQISKHKTMKATRTRLVTGLCLILVLALSSCGEKKPTKDELVKMKAEEYVKSKMNDPASYEFVKLDLLDSVTFNDNIEYRKSYFSRNMGYDKERLERLMRYKTEIPSMYKQSEVDELNEKIAKNERILTAIDSIANILEARKNEVASYTYIFSFRGNNALGAKILNEYILQTDPSPEYNVINMTNDRDKVFLNPNDFPGYKDMITKFN